MRPTINVDDELMATAPDTRASSSDRRWCEWRSKAYTGVGDVDTHLILSARMTFGGLLMTRDRRLAAQAERLGVAYAG